MRQPKHTATCSVIYARLSDFTGKRLNIIHVYPITWLKKYQIQEMTVTRRLSDEIHRTALQSSIGVTLHRLRQGLSEGVEGWGHVSEQRRCDSGRKSSASMRSKDRGAKCRSLSLCLFVLGNNYKAWSITKGENVFSRPGNVLETHGIYFQNNC